MATVLYRLTAGQWTAPGRAPINASAAQFADNGDGTWTAPVTDNGDGTWTSTQVTDNGDGTWTWTG